MRQLKFPVTRSLIRWLLDNLARVVCQVESQAEAASVVVAEAASEEVEQVPVEVEVADWVAWEPLAV